MGGLSYPQLTFHPYLSEKSWPSRLPVGVWSGSRPVAGVSLGRPADSGGQLSGCYGYRRFPWDKFDHEWLHLLHWHCSHDPNEPQDPETAKDQASGGIPNYLAGRQRGASVEDRWVGGASLGDGWSKQVPQSQSAHVDQWKAGGGCPSGGIPKKKRKADLGDHRAAETSGSLCAGLSARNVADATSRFSAELQCHWGRRCAVSQDPMPSSGCGANKSSFAVRFHAADGAGVHGADPQRQGLEELPASEKSTSGGTQGCEGAVSGFKA